MVTNKILMSVRVISETFLFVKVFVEYFRMGGTLEDVPIRIQ